MHLAAVKDADSLRFCVDCKLAVRRKFTESLSLDAVEAFGISGDTCSMRLHEICVSKAAQ
jgi:hypothetical protein